LYVLVVALLIAQLSRMHPSWRYGVVKKSSEREANWIVFLCLGAPLFFVSVILFAFAVVPYISANRGGGNYATSPRIVLTLQKMSDVPNATKFFRAEGMPKGHQPTQTRHLVLIDESPGGLFVADPYDAGGPRVWREHRNKVPQLLFVPNTSIESAAYFPMDRLRHRLAVVAANPNDDRTMNTSAALAGVLIDKCSSDSYEIIEPQQFEEMRAGNDAALSEVVNDPERIPEAGFMLVVDVIAEKQGIGISWRLLDKDRRLRDEHVATAKDDSELPSVLTGIVKSVVSIVVQK